MLVLLIYWSFHNIKTITPEFTENGPTKEKRSSQEQFSDSPGLAVALFFFSLQRSMERQLSGFI